MKDALREKAIEMRKAGHSYARIAQDVQVSKSTLALWLADVPYVPNTETIARIGRARAAAGAAKARLKQESIDIARKEAVLGVGDIGARDLFMLGLGLYIGEGSKSISSVRFANSDPAAVTLMISWLTEALGLGKKHLRIRLHLYPDCNETESLQYWSRMTTIPTEQFYKSFVDKRTVKNSLRKGKLPYGTAHVIVTSQGDKRFGVFLFRKIAAWSEHVFEKVNIAGVV